MMSEKNIQDRLAFAGMVVDQGYCQVNERARSLLEQVLFTDESIIELYPRPNAQNTRIRTVDSSLRRPIPIPKHGLKIMVGGGLSANGLTSLHVCEQNTTITGIYYRDHIMPA
jgi:hypothetical protein